VDLQIDITCTVDISRSPLLSSFQVAGTSFRSVKTLFKAPNQ